MDSENEVALEEEKRVIGVTDKKDTNQEDANVNGAEIQNVNEESKVESHISNNDMVESESSKHAKVLNMIAMQPILHLACLVSDMSTRQVAMQPIFSNYNWCRYACVSINVVLYKCCVWCRVDDLKVATHYTN